MTDRRPGPPLFELLGQDQPDDDRQGDQHQDQPKQQPAPEPAKPAEAPAPSPSSSTPPISAGVSRAERSAATMPEEPVQSEGGIHLSMPRLYLTIALVAIALVLVWATAFKAGVADGKSQMESFINNNSQVLPPLGSNTQPNQTNPTINSSTNPPPSNAVTEPPKSPARAAQEVMTAQGYSQTDPRQIGHNYLQLATLPTEQAADAILFMNDHDMPIIGVPVVDSSVRAGNNPSRYTLYSVGLAVPGGSQFRAMESQRNQHVRAIAQLGERWQRERRGGSDFAESKTQWVKYD